MPPSGLPSRWDLVKAQPEALEGRRVRITCSWDGCPWQILVTARDKIANSIAFGAQHLEVAHHVLEGPLDGPGEELTLTESEQFRALSRMLMGDSPD